MHEAQPVVVGVVGESGSGKTTLLERLVPLLAGRGLAVAAVKHASHGFQADRPGKDSHRLYRAGARAVVLASRTELAVFARHPTGAEELRLADALAALPGRADVVLVEGFSWEAIPRIVVLRDREQPAPQHLTGGEVLGIVRAPAPAAGRKPAFARAQLASLVERISDLAGRSARSA